MIRWCDNGHPPVRVRSGKRCPSCDRRRERGRATPSQRGYGHAHQQARLALASTLPRACGYATQPTCPATLIVPGSRWVAAHVLDGHPEYGWMVAHPACNERAKGGGRSETGRGSSAIPAPRSLAMHTGQDASRARGTA